MSEITKMVVRGDRARVTAGFHKAISNSFRDDGARITQSETRRRFEICRKLFEQLRGDLKWSVDRVLGHLGEYLRCELDGKAWEPSTRQVWAAE